MMTTLTVTVGGGEARELSQAIWQGLIDGLDQIGALERFVKEIKVVGSEIHFTFLNPASLGGEEVFRLSHKIISYPSDITRANICRAVVAKTREFIIALRSAHNRCRDVLVNQTVVNLRDSLR